jgi:hypothetical protein
MENVLPSLEMQRADTHLKNLLRSIDTDLLTPDEKKVVASLRRLGAEARLDIRDYEFSETRVEQLEKAKNAKKRLGRLQKALLATGNLFGPADIAQLDAQFEHIQSRIE